MVSHGTCGPLVPTMADVNDELERVLAANQAFYDAFEARDFDALSDLWEHSDRVTCTHPGWRTLHGWAQVGGSWAALLSNGQHLQFIVTAATAAIHGTTAWVTCEENLLDVHQTGTVAALNVFVSAGDCWKLVSHHGSPIMSS